MSKRRIEFDKQMCKLNAVLNENVTCDQRVLGLIDWYRKEYQARPEQYSGDASVIIAIRNEAAKGLTLSFSVNEAYKALKRNLAIMDKARLIG